MAPMLEAHTAVDHRATEEGSEPSECQDAPFGRLVFLVSDSHGTGRTVLDRFTGYVASGPTSPDPDLSWLHARILANPVGSVLRDEGPTPWVFKGTPILDACKAIVALQGAADRSYSEETRPGEKGPDVWPSPYDRGLHGALIEYQTDRWSPASEDTGVPFFHGDEVPGGYPWPTARSRAETLLAPARERLLELLRLGSGWDGFDATPPEFGTASVLYDVIRSVSDVDGSLYIAPGFDGSLVARWDLPSDAVIEIRVEGGIWPEDAGVSRGAYTREVDISTPAKLRELFSWASDGE